jgi:dTMP kinase
MARRRALSPTMPRDARFIVFEGLDGSGTTTQADRLQSLLAQRGISSFLTHEPTPDPVGAFIRRLLTQRELARDGSPYRPDEKVMGLLFAADRLAHSAHIAERLRAGETVICDRYIFSSMAYQTLDPAIRGEWVVDINRGCAIPDVTLYLATPVDVCLERVSSRRGDAGIYENRSQLETISRNYETLLPLYEKAFGRVVTIDGARGADDVHAAVVRALGIR